VEEKILAIRLATDPRRGLRRSGRNTEAHPVLRPTPEALIQLHTGVVTHVMQRILVPLDGSPLAERAYAVPTELMTEAAVDVQLAWDASFDVKETQAYLSLMQSRLNHKAPDISVQIQVQVGEFVEQVQSLESAANIGLIVMAAHSRSRLGEALRGSAFHSVLRATPHPLVVVQPSGARLE
jgi:nucleotide-binding universal stress UspA family protein